MHTAQGKCPACQQPSHRLLDWPFSGLGESVFNYTAHFYTCPHCGLGYIDNVDDAELSRFYAEECAYFSSDHFDINSKENIQKYKTYRSVLETGGLEGRSILDVGCGRGGFLRWLKQNTFWPGLCCGVDADLRSIPKEQEEGSLTFKQGYAFSLPVMDGSQEVLSYFHVLEHIRDLDRVLREASRALKPGGHLLIEVPDAERYSSLPIGTAFWIGIREHVNHFSPLALALALQRHGFQIGNTVRGLLPTPEFTYPSLIILAQKTSAPATPVLPNPQDIAAFIKDSQAELLHQAEEVTALMERYGNIAFWGCSAQLFSLLPLLDCRRITLCDASPLKQQSTFQGMAILAPEKVAPGGALVIAPYLHRTAIKRAAQELGWDESHIFSLE